MSTKNVQALQALREPLQYPGRMETFPGKMKNMPAVFIHDCIAGCPGMGPRPLMPIEGKPMRKLGNVMKRSKMKPTNDDAEELQDLGRQLKKPPGPPKPGDPPMVGEMLIGPNGEQIFYHPHYPNLKSNACNTCKHIIPVRPFNFSQKLTKRQLEEFMECFRMFDKDGDGTIDTPELGAVMRSLGQFPDEEEIEEMVDDADEDGSGNINFQEFVGLMLKRQEGGMTREEVKQAFRVFDKDGSGYVSSSELKLVMNRLGVDFSDNELEEMVLEADIDGDGQVCFEEFYAMMTAG